MFLVLQELSLLVPGITLIDALTLSLRNDVSNRYLLTHVDKYSC